MKTDQSKPIGEQFNLETLDGRKAAWAWLVERFGKPELVVTKDGVPFDDQVEGIRQFKAQAIKPTGEWTAVLVKEMVEVGGGYNAVALVHNSALAEATDAAVQEMLLVKQQLAAEREKVTLATQMVQIESKRANEAEQKVQMLVELPEQVLNETVDAREYPDGPCLDGSTRREIKDALAKVAK